VRERARNRIKPSLSSQLEVFSKPARGLTTDRIKQCMSDHALRCSCQVTNITCRERESGGNGPVACHRVNLTIASVPMHDASPGEGSFWSRICDYGGINTKPIPPCIHKVVKVHLCLTTAPAVGYLQNLLFAPVRKPQLPVAQSIDSITPDPPKKSSMYVSVKRQCMTAGQPAALQQ